MPSSSSRSSLSSSRRFFGPRLGLLAFTDGVILSTRPVRTSTADPIQTSFFPFFETSGPLMTLSAYDVSNGSGPSKSSTVGDSGIYANTKNIPEISVNYEKNEYLYYLVQ